jgi:hypothetical protein
VLGSEGLWGKQQVGFSFFLGEMEERDVDRVLYKQKARTDSVGEHMVR